MVQSQVIQPRRYEAIKPGRPRQCIGRHSAQQPAQHGCHICDGLTGSPRSHANSSAAIVTGVGLLTRSPPMHTHSQREKFMQGTMAFAAVAGSGLAAFVVEQGGTVVVLEGLRR